MALILLNQLLYDEKIDYPLQIALFVLINVYNNGLDVSISGRNNNKVQLL